MQYGKVLKRPNCMHTTLTDYTSQMKTSNYLSGYTYLFYFQVAFFLKMCSLCQPNALLINQYTIWGPYCFCWYHCHWKSLFSNLSIFRRLQILFWCLQVRTAILSEISPWSELPTLSETTACTTNGYGCLPRLFTCHIPAICCPYIPCEDIWWPDTFKYCKLAGITTFP